MNYLNSQLQLTRQKILSEIEGINPELFDIQPKGFNNTLHWHIGHILTVTEQFLLGYPHTNHLPANYGELFGYGSKPADWKGDVPSVEVLVQQLQEQANRILAIPEERYSEKLAQPFLGLETVGEIFTFALFHESNHLGQIHAMKRVIDAAN
ncbi:DinB family protein [Peribacillus asahii]|uniref:DinB family protein n=1 Tax=Peribacillus asahii TaxID=228899 RepID=UPI002079D828|nr:DinB family protein [Peribacillus asahii]USK85935.1 DinB family protein [Peribacillus asahii]